MEKYWEMTKRLGGTRIEQSLVWIPNQVGNDEKVENGRKSCEMADKLWFRSWIGQSFVFTELD